MQATPAAIFSEVSDMVRLSISTFLFLAIAGASAGGVLAQNAAPAAEASFATDRAKSDALTPEQRDQARKLFETAFALLQSGDFQAAELGFEQGVAIDPANTSANFYMAEALAVLGDMVRARIFYNKVIAFDPNSAEALKAQVALNNLPGRTPTDAVAKAHSAPAQAADCAQAEAHWKSAEEIKTLAAYEDHVARFPDCAFAGLAKARIAALDKNEPPKPHAIPKKVAKRQAAPRADEGQTGSPPPLNCQNPMGMLACVSHALTTGQ
jgi:tetratricopeptide (TPR) repeat protein